MNKRPYIGISGFMCEDEVWEAALAYREAWRSAGKEPTHDLMVGLLTSSKTLNGKLNKHPRRYPLIEQVNRIFPRCSRCGGRGVIEREPFAATCPRCSIAVSSFRRLNLVHYASDKEPCLTELFDLFDRAGAYCHGFQFNNNWPSAIDLTYLRQRARGLRFVLQVGPKMLANFWGNPGRLLDVMAPYTSLIEEGAIDVLLDVSGGEGRSLDVDAKIVRQMIAELTLEHPWLGIGFAGGLRAETLPALAPIARAYSKLSIDAESGLRDGADGGGNLDYEKMRAYLQNAVRLVTGAEQTPAVLVAPPQPAKSRSLTPAEQTAIEARRLLAETECAEGSDAMAVITEDVPRLLEALQAEQDKVTKARSVARNEAVRALRTVLQLLGHTELYDRTEEAMLADIEYLIKQRGSRHVGS